VPPLDLVVHLPKHDTIAEVPQAASQQLLDPSALEARSLHLLQILRQCSATVDPKVSLPVLLGYRRAADRSGLFAGLTLDGTILVERKDANRDFYGSSISATDILTCVSILLGVYYSRTIGGSHLLRLDVHILGPHIHSDRLLHSLPELTNP
jgi:hypothetical protein